MKRILKLLAFTFLLFLVATSVFAQVKVKGYYRKNGTYVQPHYRSSPNSTKRDNYSSKGNVNLYTGKAGTVNPSKGKSSSEQSVAIQCMGITQKGNQCKRTTTSSSGRCWQHE